MSRDLVENTDRLLAMIDENRERRGPTPRRSDAALMLLVEAEHVVRHDPVLAELRERRLEAEGNRGFRAVMLAPTMAICRALLRGESVPIDQLDQTWVWRFGLRADHLRRNGS